MVFGCFQPVDTILRCLAFSAAQASGLLAALTNNLLVGAAAVAAAVSAFSAELEEAAAAALYQRGRVNLIYRMKRRLPEADGRGGSETPQTNSESLSGSEILLGGGDNMFQALLWTNWVFGRNIHLFCPHEDACRLMELRGNDGTAAQGGVCGMCWFCG